MRGLREAGYAVDAARDGTSALTQLASNTYDAVVLDIMIPAPDGFEVCRQMRSSNLTTPVLMLTARDAVADRIAGLDCGAEANMAKMLAADASWEAANACVQTHGGFGFAEEYDVERKFRETRLYQVAPISTNLVLSYLAEHVLGMPRSY